MIYSGNYKVIFHTRWAITATLQSTIEIDRMPRAVATKLTSFLTFSSYYVWAEPMQLHYSVTSQSVACITYVSLRDNTILAKAYWMKITSVSQVWNTPKGCECKYWPYMNTVLAYA